MCKCSLYYVNASVNASNFVTELMPRVVSQRGLVLTSYKEWNGGSSEEDKALTGTFSKPVRAIPARARAGRRLSNLIMAGIVRDYSRSRLDTRRVAVGVIQVSASAYDTTWASYELVPRGNMNND